MYMKVTGNSLSVEQVNIFHAHKIMNFLQNISNIFSVVYIVCVVVYWVFYGRVSAYLATNKKLFSTMYFFKLLTPCY